MEFKISLIACIGKNRELGYKGKLCFNIEKDMDFFVEKTKLHTVIMGRKTYESIGHPLVARNNIVITHTPIKGIQCSENLPFILGKLKAEEKREIFIIGGASIYEQALPYADAIYLTEVDKSVNADVYFPEFDKTLFTKQILVSDSENGVNFDIVAYRRKRC